MTRPSVAGAVAPLSFEDWYASVAERLTRGIVAAVGDPVVGREAAAEALARAYERWSRVGAMESPEGWVHTTAVNLCRRSWRRRQLEKRSLAKLGAGRVTIIDDAPDVLVAGHSSDDVAAALDALTPRMRTAVELRYWRGLSEAQVAEAMDISTGTASALLSQARRRLSTELERTRADDGHTTEDPR